MAAERAWTGKIGAIRLKMPMARALHATRSVHRLETAVKPEVPSQATRPYKLRQARAGRWPDLGVGTSRTRVDLFASPRASGPLVVTLSSHNEPRTHRPNLRTEAHPLITFRDGPTGRRAALINGPDVWEVVAALVGSDTPPARRQARVADLLGLSPTQVSAAMDYYAEFTAEIDQRIALTRAEADRQLALWEQKQRLLAQ